MPRNVVLIGTNELGLQPFGLALRRDLGDKRGPAFALSNRGNVARAQGHYGRATVLHQESLSLEQAITEALADA